MRPTGQPAVAEGWVGALHVHILVERHKQTTLKGARGGAELDCQEEEEAGTVNNSVNMIEEEREGKKRVFVILSQPKAAPTYYLPTYYHPCV